MPWTMPKNVNLKRKVTLLRYNDSGTAMVWLEGGEDKSPVIAIDLLTGMDIHTVAMGVANDKFPENENKARYTTRRLCTQAMAEYGFTVWYEKEGTEIDKDSMKSLMKSMKWNPNPLVVKNGWTITVVGTSDYHSDLFIDSKMLRSGRQIFVHAVRFGKNEKILLKGWTSSKYIKLVATVATKEYKAKSGRMFKSEKYSMSPEELFPMSLLRDQLVKRNSMTEDDKKQVEIEGVKDDGFGF